jgi:hypothetical protein
MDLNWRTSLPEYAEYDWHDIYQEDYEKHVRKALKRKYRKNVEFQCTVCAKSALLNDDYGYWSDPDITYSILGELQWYSTFDELNAKWNKMKEQIV